MRCSVTFRLLILEMKGERWDVFRGPRGEWGRDLAEVPGLGQYGSIWTALRQLEQRRAEDSQLARFLSSARHKLAKANKEM